MDQKKLDQQSQHWEINFSNKPEMFGLSQSLAAEKALNLFKKNKINKIIEFGAGLGRDSIFFAKNLIYTLALDYSPAGLNIIEEKIKKKNLPKISKINNVNWKTIDVLFAALPNGQAQKISKIIPTEEL